MAKWTVGKGMDVYVSQLTKLNANTKDILGRSIYFGAEKVADEVRKQIEQIPETPNLYGTPTHPRTGITKEQKEGLLDGLGIAKMQDDNGYLQVKIGMDGYNSIVTRNYPKGQPNAMVARMIESGTSFQHKHPFINKAVQKTRRSAEKAMADELDKQIKQIVK